MGSRTKTRKVNRKWRKRESGCGGEVGREKTESNWGRGEWENVCHTSGREKKVKPRGEERNTNGRKRLKPWPRKEGNQRYGKG